MYQESLWSFVRAWYQCNAEVGNQRWNGKTCVCACDSKGFHFIKMKCSKWKKGGRAGERTKKTNKNEMNIWRGRIKCVFKCKHMWKSIPLNGHNQHIYYTYQASVYTWHDMTLRYAVCHWSNESAASAPRDDNKKDTHTHSHNRIQMWVFWTYIFFSFFFISFNIQ